MRIVTITCPQCGHSAELPALDIMFLLYKDTEAMHCPFCSTATNLVHPTVAEREVAPTHRFLQPTGPQRKPVK